MIQVHNQGGVDHVKTHHNNCLIDVMGAFVNAVSFGARFFNICCIGPGRQHHERSETFVELRMAPRW